MPWVYMTLIAVCSQTHTHTHAHTHTRTYTHTQNHTQPHTHTRAPMLAFQITDVRACTCVTEWCVEIVRPLMVCVRICEQMHSVWAQANKQCVKLGFTLDYLAPLNLRRTVYTYFVIQQTLQENLTFITVFYIINSLWFSLFFLIIMPSLR